MSLYLAWNVPKMCLEKQCLAAELELCQGRFMFYVYSSVALVQHPTGLSPVLDLLVLFTVSNQCCFLNPEKPLTGRRGSFSLSSS